MNIAEALVFVTEEAEFHDAMASKALSLGDDGKAKKDSDLAFLYQDFMSWSLIRGEDCRGVGEQWKKHWYSGMWAVTRSLVTPEQQPRDAGACTSPGTWLK